MYVKNLSSKTGAFKFFIMSLYEAICPSVFLFKGIKDVKNEIIENKINFEPLFSSYFFLPVLDLPVLFKLFYTSVLFMWGMEVI